MLFRSLIQTSSKKILRGEEFVVIDKKFLQSYEECWDDEDEDFDSGYDSRPLSEPKEKESIATPAQTNVPQSKSEEKKEKKRMNIFGINMEFGMNTDENITSTFIGVAVKNGKSWRVYDKKKKTLTDIGDMSMP